MKKIYLTYCLLFYFIFTLQAQTSYPPMVITAGTPFSLQVAGASRYQGVANFGELYDPVVYGKGIQISRSADQGDNAFHLSFIRSGQKVAGLGFLRNSNTFAIQNNSDNTSGSGVFLTQEGNVGVKMSSPQYALDINGEARLSGLRLFMNNYGVLYSDQNNMALFTDGGYVFGNKDNSKTRAIIESDGSLDLYKAGGIAIRFSPVGNSFINTGNIGIGTTDPGSYKLAVEGTIGARRIKVTQQAWADFVFDSTYMLPSLKEIEAHAKSCKHLPGIPSANEIAQQGLDIGDMQQRQMQKIEELTLYLIDQNKKLEKQQQLILELNDRLKELEGKQSK